VTIPLPPVPGPEIAPKQLLTPPWQAWFTQLYVYVTQGSSGGGGIVPIGRRINTTAPLAGGATLASDITLSVGTFGAAVSGVVPASGGGTLNYLRADGTWTGAVTSVSAGDGLTTAPNPIVGAGTVSLQNRFADTLLMMGA